MRNWDPRPRAVWVTLAALGIAVLAFLVGLGTGAAGSSDAATDGDAASPQPRHAHADEDQDVGARPARVHPGAFCSPHRSIGYTTRGTRMRCTTKPGDVGPNGPYWRWRSAG